VHFHDADDWFDPSWCLRVRQAIDQTGHDALFTEVTSIYQGRRYSERVLGLRRLNVEPDLVRFCLGGSMLVPAGTYRRDVVLAVDGYRERLWQAEDFDFHVRLAASGISYTVLDEPLVLIRLRTEGRSQRQVEVWSSAVQAVAELANELPPRYRADLAESAARSGSALYRLGAAHESHAAFNLARRLGPPTFVGQSPVYRLVARTFTPELAEWLGARYRSTLPHAVRARVSQA
jgi:hypothetical protein